MKTCLGQLTRFAAGAGRARPAVAQPAPPPLDGAPTARPQAVTREARTPPAALPTTLAANTRAAQPVPVTRTVVAAGSVLVLVDGVVASARIAPAAVPAPGYVYER